MYNEHSENINEISDDFQAKLIENWQNTEGVIINIE